MKKEIKLHVFLTSVSSVISPCEHWPEGYRFHCLQFSDFSKKASSSPLFFLAYHVSSLCLWSVCFSDPGSSQPRLFHLDRPAQCPRDGGLKAQL